MKIAVIVQPTRFEIDEESGMRLRYVQLCRLYHFLRSTAHIQRGGCVILARESHHG